jgi:hypothetical protein
VASNAILARESARLDLVAGVHRTAPIACRRRLCRQLGVAGLQCKRLPAVRIRLERETAGAAQGDGTGRYARPYFENSVSRFRLPRCRQVAAVARRAAQLNFRGADQERTVATFGRSSTDAVIVTSGPWPESILRHRWQWGQRTSLISVTGSFTPSDGTLSKLVDGQAGNNSSQSTDSVGCLCSANNYRKAPTRAGPARA